MRDKKREVIDTLKLVCGAAVLFFTSWQMMESNLFWLIFPISLLAGPFLAFITKNEFQIHLFSYISIAIFLASLVTLLSQIFAESLVLETEYPEIVAFIFVVGSTVVVAAIRHLWAVPIERIALTRWAHIEEREPEQST
ncbi:hypothetical protein [Erythrobacter aurantius]|uniref:hypothetical protein n=1 Tax=Erythrobacter aurantius TaxID=2909249 RepID=UPI0020795916|nr:hypothetical protein [Erythrobacter aurantius]